MDHVISKNLRSDFAAMHRCVKSRQSQVAFACGSATESSTVIPQYHKILILCISSMVFFFFFLSRGVVALDTSFSEINRKRGVTRLNVPNWLQSWVFRMPNFPLIWKFWSSSNDRCRWKWYSDDRSTTVLPKPFATVEVYHLQKLSVFFFCPVYWCTIVMESCSRTSKLWLKKICVLESSWCWQDIYNIWKHQLHGKEVQLGKLWWWW